MREVEFDFQTAGQEINRLDETAEKLRQTAAGPYEDTLQELMLGWQGEEVMKFIRKAEILKDKMTGTSALIGRTKEALHQAALKAEAMEKRAKEIAEDRT